MRLILKAKDKENPDLKELKQLLESNDAIIVDELPYLKLIECKGFTGRPINWSVHKETWYHQSADGGKVD